jgi:hypothetical protein
MLLIHTVDLSLSFLALFASCSLPTKSLLTCLSHLHKWPLDLNFIVNTINCLVLLYTYLNSLALFFLNFQPKCIACIQKYLTSFVRGIRALNLN